MEEGLNLQKCARNLGEVDLFRDLDEQQLHEVAKLCAMLTSARGDYVMREGEHAEGFYILLKGEVSVSKKLSMPHLEHTDTEDRILTSISADGHPALGETAIIGQDYRSATVRCNSDCVLYRIDAAALLALARQSPAIGCHVFRRLSETLYQRMESTSVDVVKLTAALMYALEE